MERKWTCEQIIEGVTEVLEEALGKDPGTVHLDNTLIEDLGAESIDFLDIAFNLGLRFNIEVVYNTTLSVSDRSLKYVTLISSPADSTVITCERLCRIIAERLEVQWIASQPAHA